MQEPMIAEDTFSCLIHENAARAEKVSELVARLIVRDIATAGYSIGMKLPSELEMSERYGVGRGSLREALRILEVQGLITIKSGPGGGPVVAGMSAQRLGATAALHLQMVGATLGSVAEARLVLEPVLARQAAQRRDRIATERLLALAGAPTTGNLERDLRLAGAFHTAVLQASGNAVLALLGDTLREIWTARLRGLVYGHEDRDVVCDEHRDIARAIHQGHPAQAEELMRTHMAKFVQLAHRSYPAMLDEVVEWH